MKLKITDEKLDELISQEYPCGQQSSHETTYGSQGYNIGFRAAEQMHQAKFDTAMHIIEMQNKSFKEIYADGSYKDIASEIAIKAITETDKELLNLLRCEK